MKLPALIHAATFGLAHPAMAETSAPATPAPASAAAAPSLATPDAAPDEKGKVKEIRAACRAEVKGQRLKGEDRMKAVSDCVAKQRPDLTQREQCRMEGWQNGLRKDELKGFVKDCAKAKG